MKRVSWIIIGVVMVSFLLDGQGFCQSIYDDLYSSGYSDEITMVIGQVVSIPVNSPTRVSVRNPELVDISKATDREVVCVGKQVGDTAVTIWDRDGERIFYLSVYSQDLDMVQRKLERLIKQELGIRGVRLRKNEATGKIIILGEVASYEKEQVENALEPYAERVDNLLRAKKANKMVEIEGHILELQKNELDRLGVKWMEYIQFREEPYVAAGGASGAIETTLNRVDTTGILRIINLSRDALHARINMLVQDGRGRELSRPKLLCLSGEEAKLLVGGEVPYISAQTTTSVGLGVTIEYKEYGVILNLRPTVLSDGKIYLSVGTEISELDWANAITVSGFLIPAFTKREANTVLNLKSGETIFIAGLIQKQDSTTVDKFPGLASLPILGALFRSKEFQNDETELVISLTPRVVEFEEQEQMISLKEVAPAKYEAGLELYQGAIPDELRGYVWNIQRKIAENMTYPPVLLDTGWEGVVTLHLTIDYTGQLKSTRIAKSSGYKVFDDGAVRLVKNLSFSPFPPDVRLDELNIEVPIVYREKR